MSSFFKTTVLVDSGVEEQSYVYLYVSVLLIKETIPHISNSHKMCLNMH